MSFKSGGSKITENCSNEISQICSVCAEVEPKFWSISPCNHKICWICSLRLRSLYGSKACPICKSQCDFVFIGNDCRPSKDSEYFFANPKKSKYPLNEGLSIAFQNEIVRTCCESLLLFQCSFNHSNSKVGNFAASQSGCLKHFKSKNELKRHVQSAHDLQVCEICLEHKKCFTVELPLFNRSSLQKHQRDVNHPRCQVCDQIFYSEDELAEHCRDAHELCHICQRTGRPNRYFQNYSKLEEHFRRDHYLCPEPLCRELKFIVFENELEYKTHQAEVHLSHQKLQRSQQRQLQRLNISFNTPSSPSSNTASSSNHPTMNSGVAAPSQPPSLKLTSDQRNQIATNLIYGEVTDDLANRLQSLSLYQNRNDEFIDTILRRNLHLNQKQIQELFEISREYQQNKLSGTEFILKIEKLIPSASPSTILKVSRGLSELQLDEMKRQKLNVAISEFSKKCSSFPELSSKQKPNSKVSSSWGKAQTFVEEDSKDIVDPFGFARKHPVNNKPTGIVGVGSGGIKVLQILKPSSPSPNASSDPSRNPAMLLSQLAGAPGPKKKKSSNLPSKITTFSSAALGSTSAINGGKKMESSKIDEYEFPKLGINTGINNSNTGLANSNTGLANSNTGTAVSNKESIPTNTSSAFFAPSDRDQLDSFTIGPEKSEDSDGLMGDDSNKKDKKGSKTKKVVFRYGQKWDSF